MKIRLHPIYSTVVLLVILTVNMVCVPTAVAQTPEAEKMFNGAVAAANAGQSAVAEKRYRALVAKYPDNAAAWANLGLLRMQANNYNEALTYLKKAVVLNPNVPVLRQKLAAVYLRAGKPNDALRESRQVLSVDPKNDAAQQTLAVALLALKRFDEAGVIFQSRSEMLKQSKNPDADRQNLTLWAVALMRAGRKTEALAVARDFTKWYPGDPNAFLLRGDLAAQTGKENEAQTAYTHAAQLDPKNGAAARNAALLDERLGNRDQARQLLQKRIADAPEDAAAQFQLGRMYSEEPTLETTQRLAQAEPHLRAAVLADPKNLSYLTTLGNDLMLQGGDKLDEAAKVYNLALKLSPKYPPARMGMAFIAERRQQFPAAIAAYRAILEDTPNEYGARRRLAGLLYQSAGKDKNRHLDAFVEMEKLVELFPKDTVALDELGSLYMQDENYAAAQSAYQRLLKRDPNNLHAFVGLGQLAERRSENPTAETAYRRALTIAPGDNTANFVLVELLDRTDRNAAAATLMEKLVALQPQNSAARWRLSQEYIKLKRDDDAFAQMRAIQPDTKDPARLAYILGPANLYTLRGKHAEAVAELEKLATTQPNEEIVQYFLADALDKAGRSDDSAKVLRKLADGAKPNDYRPILARASLSEQHEKWDDAATFYENILRADPLSTAARIGLKRARDKQKTPEKVPAFYEMLVFAQSDKPNLDAVAALLDSYDTGTQGTKSVDLTKRIAERYPQQRDALLLYAQNLVRYAKGDADRETAVTTYRQAALLEPKDGNPDFQIGRIREMQNRSAEAIQAYQNALIVNPKLAPAEQALNRLKPGG